MNRLAATAGSVIWLVVAPGIVAGLVPWWITGWDADDPSSGWLPVRIVGWLLIAIGTAVLLESFTRFALYGRGTPAPAAPTERLVVTGLYRHVRNPMYVAVEAVIVGQAFWLVDAALLGYAAAVAVVSLGFVKGYEEPALRRRFGAEYDAYCAAVPAWWPRIRAWR